VFVGVSHTYFVKTEALHCTLTAGSADVEVQNIFNMGNNITCSANCKYRTAATVYTIETWFVSGV